MIVGVTGGIGAGKSTVCAVFEEAGAHVIDADAVGHDVLRDPAVIRNLVDAFGPEILDAAGRVIRRAVGELAFASDEGRKKLNAAVWQPLRQALSHKIQAALDRDPNRPVVVDAALLIERGDPKAWIDILVVVTAPEPVRIERTMARLGISETEVKARIAAQLPEKDKVAVADFVVVNDATPTACRQRAMCVWQQLQSDVRQYVK